MNFRMSRPNSCPSEAAYETTAIRRSGLRVRNQSGPTFVTLVLFPSCGSMEMMRRLMRPASTPTRAWSIKSRAGVCTVVGSMARARAPGVG